MISRVQFRSILRTYARRSTPLQAALYARSTMKMLAQPWGREAFEPARLVTRFQQWSASQRIGATALAQGEPWITFAARDFLESYLSSSMRVFEYGSGGSSIFFSQRVAFGISIEHDSEWYRLVQNRLAELGISNWRVKNVGPDSDPPKNDGNVLNPASYATSESGYRHLSFRSYAAAVDDEPDNSTDVVMLDGRARPSCFLHSRPKVRAGGLLVLDNSERPHYQYIHETLREFGWRKRVLAGPGPYGWKFWSTTIWQRPE